MDIAERLAGGVMGHLVGDAVGVPYESGPPVSPGDVEFGATGTHAQPPGTWSDDGALMLAQLDSLLSVGFDPADFGRRALDWYRGGAYTPDGDGCFDIGGATRTALERLEAGVAAEQAGGTDDRSCGNGSLMRILPLALVERDVPAEVLVDHAHRLSAVTHGHVRPQVACALYALIGRSLLRGHARGDALAWARGRLRGIYEALADGERHLAALDHLEGWQERSGRGAVWDAFWSAWDAFAGADSYRETIQCAVAYGNDTDTTAAIAGGLAGLRFGLSGIPAEWLAGLRGREVVGPLVERLLATAGRLTSAEHPIRVDWVDPADVPPLDAWSGTLGMTFLPGKRAAGLVGQHWRDLEADLERLRSFHGADVLLVMVEDEELDRFGVGGLVQAAAAAGLELLRHPVTDGGVPADVAAFRRSLDAVVDRLRMGAGVVVACRGGLGRTGLAVACLLRELAGLSGADAIARVRAVRKGAVETHEQEAFIADWMPSERHPAVVRPLADRLADLGALEHVLASASADDFGTWSKSVTKGGVMSMPYFEFGPVGEKFYGAATGGGWVFPFDWGTWLGTAEGKALGDDREALARATPLQLARLLTAIIRSERFTEGSIEGAFTSGLLVGITRRAAVLAEELRH